MPPPEDEATRKQRRRNLVALRCGPDASGGERNGPVGFLAPDTDPEPRAGLPGRRISGGPKTGSGVSSRGGAVLGGSDD